MDKLSKCIAEAIGTFALIFIGIGAIKAEPGLLGVALAHGLTIALDILFAGPLTGGAMNPARVFGPALAVSFWNAHYVYWIGPMVGGALGGIVYKMFLLPKN